MDNKNIRIGENFCFTPEKKSTIIQSKNALNLYAENFEKEAKGLDSKLPIILDTNVLLNYYGMAKLERDKLLTFLKKFKHRIYLTRQVEKEFIKNRVNTIQTSWVQPIEVVVNDYNRMQEDITSAQKKIVDALKTFKERKKKVFENDYPHIWEKLKNIEEQIVPIEIDESLFNEIENAIGEVKQKNKNIEVQDEFLNICSEFKVIDLLDTEEVVFLEKLYLDLYKNYKAESDQNKRIHIAFPGCGEEQAKSGDFIIFHEILKFMKQENTMCVFLTNDTSKNDWVQKVNRKPFVHYIENCYYLTEQILFILQAKSLLQNISFENIIETDNNLSENVVQDSSSSMSNLMRLVLASQSIQDNIKFGIYYHGNSRGYRNHKYIGLYEGKKVSAIGQIENIIKADLDEDGKLIVSWSQSEVTPTQENRIRGAINEAMKRGWYINEDRTFFCVDKFHTTNFVKTSLYAPMGTKFFNLNEILKLDNLPNTEGIAELLKRETWE